MGSDARRKQFGARDFRKLRNSISMNLEDSKRLHFIELLRIYAVDVCLAPILRPEWFVRFNVLFANKDVLIFRERRNPFYFTIECISDDMRSELRTNKFDVFVIIIDIFDEFRQLLNPLLVHGNQFVTYDVLGFFA